MSDEINIDYLARYRAEPGDTIILRLGQPLPDAGANRRMMRHLGEVFPGQSVLVLGPGDSIEIVNGHEKGGSA
jgi:hypothetical protein